ncbi:hypothetical protein [Clostridium estertheticum]|uniref:hypothetical protein n=1 Tax=Clostridium estertheticum TaxID=238834 RepID=UPI001C0BAD24|nr:hypothetical protein [Clostridium estertheticum]MBU3173293.1 hypothetical protein [Clostridium estertheticum]
MVNVLKCMLFICFVILAYMFVRYVESKLSKKIKEARGEENYSQTNSFKKFKYNLEKIENLEAFQTIFAKTQKKLDSYGNYFVFVTPTVYYLIKIVAILLVLLLIFTAKKLNIFTFIPPVLAFIFIDVSYLIRNADDNEEIRNDLPKIYNILEINTFAGEGIETSISQLHEVVKNKRFKEKLIELSAEVLIKKEVGLALKNFEKSFTLIEIKSLCLGLRQSFDSGKNKDFLSNQRDILEKRNLNKKDIQTKRNNLKFTISLLLIFTGVIGVLMFSFYLQIFSNISKLFG